MIPPVTTTRRALAATLCTALIPLAGCGEKTVDSGEVEEQISDKLVELRNVRPKEVDCPSDMKAKKGETYRCTITAPNGETIGTTVEMTDDDGGFRFEVDERPS